jgi:hypothetical protein
LILFRFLYNKKIRQFQNILAFYRSTLAINLAVSFLPLLFNKIGAFLFLFTTFGYVVSIAIKEVYKNDNYLFYYNNRLTKIQLWIYGMILNFVTALFFFLLIVFFLKLIR